MASTRPGWLSFILASAITSSCSGSNSPTLWNYDETLDPPYRRSSMGGGVGDADTETDSGGADSNPDDFTPTCADLTTEAGAEVVKGAACTEADPPLCYRTCGPQSIGFKPETCVSGRYAEGDCAFPSDGNYACYKIPPKPDAGCPATVPQAGTACDVPECTPCNSAGTYKDSGGAVKIGDCICLAADDGQDRRWSCASATAWPCPLGRGC